MPVDLERLLERAPQPLGDAHRIARIPDVVQQHVELVAAEPRQREPGSSRATASVGRRLDCSRRATATSSRSAVSRPRLSLDHVEPVEAEDEQREDVVRDAAWRA